MSDIQGDRPESSADDAAPAQPADAAAQTPSTPPATPVSANPAPPIPQSAAAPAAPAAPAYGAGHPVAGQPAAAQPVAGQPAQPRPVYGQYTGQPAQPQPAQLLAGQAFGLTPTHAQPTLPIAGAQPATGTTATATKQRKGGGVIAGAIVAALVVGGAAGFGGAYVGNQLWPAPASSSASAPSVVTVNNTEKVNATTAIAAKVVPSVVTIEASSGNAGGTGSGVVLTSDGYVVTNTHVVTLDGETGDATLRVTTSDGHVYDAKVVGTDPIYDLAVIKLEGASNLTPIEFGDSSKLNVGDQTVAVGAPLGLSNSVTTGIVSALNRSIEIASSAAPDSSDSGDGSDDGDNGGNGDNGQGGPFYFDFGQGQTQQQSTTDTIKIAVIQTDAAINPGNSGGALVDSDGELIGINVAIATAGGSSSSEQSGSIGVGFSIPSDIVKRVSDELIKDGKATHGLLGASVQSATSVKGSTITGAYIAEVVSGGAAAAGGLEKGDIVTEFNGVPVTDSVDLTAQVRAAAAGSKATVTYVRDGKTYKADVTLGSLQE